MHARAWLGAAEMFPWRAALELRGRHRCDVVRSRRDRLIELRRWQAVWDRVPLLPPTADAKFRSQLSRLHSLPERMCLTDPE